MIIDHPVNTPAAWSLRASSYEESWAACGWSRSSQTARFAAVLAAASPQSCERVLDFGCGTGGFSDWLPMDTGYVGYDTAPGMVARAAREHPDRVFQTWMPTGMFDVTVAVGPFNLPGPGGKTGVLHTLRYLWERTTRVLVATLYAGRDVNCERFTETDVRPLLGEAYLSSVKRWRDNDLLLRLER